jgi:oligoendopeptidase F
MESKDRVLRKNAFDSMYNNYKNSEQSTTEIYLSEVKIENEFAKLLNYNSLLDRSTKADESTTKVYDALISSVNKNMKIYHKYNDLRKKVLGLNDYTSYDLYVNIIETADDKKYTIEEARDIILENLSILRRRIYISSKKSIF